MILSKNIFLLGIALFISITGCSDRKDSSLVEENSTSAIEVMDELKPLVINSHTVYSINNKKYEIDTLPSSYLTTSGQDRKQFLDLYIKYKLVLDDLKNEKSFYKKEIDDKIKLELNKIEYRGITQSILEKTVYIQKITLETIALEEVAKKEENLTKKIEEVYKSRYDEFKYPDTIELSIIVSKNKEKLKNILFNLSKTDCKIQDFVKYVSENSIDKRTISIDGYAGYMTKETAGEEIFNAVWSEPKLGLLNKILEKDKNFILIYTHKKMKAGIQSLDSVKDEVRENLLNAKRNIWIRKRYIEIMKKTKVKIYDSFEDNQTF